MNHSIQPARDVRQIRLRRLRMGLLSWITSFALALYAWVLGLLDMTLGQFAMAALVVLVMQLWLHIAIRSGWSERFNDPSLTLWQILAATLVALYVIGHADEARPVLLMLFIIAAFFGVFQLRKEQYIFVSLVAVFGFAMIILGEIFGTESPQRRRLLLLELGVFAVVMFWLAFVGSYVADLRRKLSLRNRELRQASRELQHLADHDELTGLPNRRRLLAHLERAQAAAEKHDLPFCVAIVDLDHFKRVNDRYGHQAGDQVLAEFARRAEDVLRGADQLVRVDESLPDIGRFGGEEFLAVLPGTDLKGARLAAERLRESVANQPFATSADDIECTVSIGLADYRPGEPVHRTVGRADEALYQAKSSGRNQTRHLPHDPD
jgi:diguanylate cyclase